MCFYVFVMRDFSNKACNAYLTFKAGSFCRLCSVEAIFCIGPMHIKHADTCKVYLLVMAFTFLSEIPES